MAELAWVTGYVVRQITKRARCRVTALIENNALPLHQTATYVVC